MLAVAEASALAVKQGLDLGVFYEVLSHSTGDCVALRTRIPFEGARPDTPASNGWKPGFMTELMAKDVDLVLREAGARERAGAAASRRCGRCSTTRSRRATAAKTSRRSAR